MNILHISDFHYDGDRRIIDNMLPAIADCIKQSGKQIDFILFTGDLVSKGSIVRYFEEARAVLLDYLCSSLGVRQENVILCPGNHDIDRGQIRHAHDSFLKTKIADNESLNNLYKDKLVDKFLLGDLLQPLSNYQSFIKLYHPESNDNVYGKLYSIHYRMYNGLKQAFVCLYTPWLCNMDSKSDDYSTLMLPDCVFDEINEKLDKNVARKIVLMHHPLSWLREFNSYEVENHIYDDFNMLFVGHVHKQVNIVRYNGSNGIYEHTAKASLSKKEMLGCTLIENNEFEDNKFNVSEITYIKDSNDCHIGNAVTMTVPIGSEKEEVNKLRRKVYEKVSIEKENADNLLLLKKDEGGQDFLNTYNTPLIRSSKESASNQSATASISLDSIYYTDKHLIVLGKDKCGKTSLLRRIQLEYLMNFTKYNKVPFFIDAREEENKIDDSYDITNAIRGYIAINKNVTNELINSDRLVILVDNFRTGTAMANYLGHFFTVHPHALMIAAGEDVISASYELSNVSFGDVRNTSILFFNDLRKREIIQYTDMQLANEANKVQIQEKILKLCKQMELPYNYWTISLFLLIHHKASDAYSKNLFAILDVCVDEIFDKKKILIEKWPITYNQLKALGAKLAMNLFECHLDDVYSASKDDIIKFLENVINKNKRYTVTPGQIFTFFVSCGLLKVTSTGYYVFRLNGFFEYFLAYEMTQDSKFKQTILNDESKYLAFKNQLEIYSGLKSNDSEFLKFVFDRTVQKCYPLFKDYSDDKDRELSAKIEIPKELEKEAKALSVNALSSLQRAEVEDRHESGSVLQSEVHLIESIDPNQNSIDVLGRYLAILSRVFKNIDQVEYEIIDPISVFKTIINYYCDFSFYIIEELSQRTKICIETQDFGNIDEEEAFKLLKLMSNYSPLIAQMEVYDGVGHFSIENMVRDEIKELKANASHNQYKLFILYFLLFDLSLDSRESLMDDALSSITMPLLRYMMNLKFNYYLAFRSDGNKPLQSTLSQKIRMVRKLLDNKVDADSIEVGITDTKKEALVHKQKNG